MGTEPSDACKTTCHSDLCDEIGKAAGRNDGQEVAKSDFPLPGGGAENGCSGCRAKGGRFTALMKAGS
jgi:hypothetical protein